MGTTVFPIYNGPARYEYIRLEIDLGDLEPLNALSGDGWRVVASFQEDGPATMLIPEPHKANYVLLERVLPGLKYYDDSPEQTARDSQQGG